MYALGDLNPGDVIVTQITQDPKPRGFENGETYQYDTYTVTGTVGDGITLNGGTHALIQSKESGVYAIWEFANTYRSRFYAVQGLFRKVTTWEVTHIATFTGDDAKCAADDYVALLNKAREVLAHADVSPALQKKPHTITSAEAHSVIASAIKHVQWDTTSTLKALKSARNKMKDVAAKSSKAHSRNSNSGKLSNAPLRILTNQEGALTCYGFIEGSIVKLTTLTTTKTLQVTGGNNTTIHLNDSKGNPAGSITLQREHFGHEDEVATRELLAILDDEDGDSYVLCSGCSDPEWLIDVLMFTPTSGEAEQIEEYTANKNMTFQQEEAFNKLYAWQENKLESVRRSLGESRRLCDKHGFEEASSSIYSVDHEVYGAMYGKGSPTYIQRLNSSLQDALDSAMLNVERVSKERVAEVENTLSGLVAVNERVSM